MANTDTPFGFRPIRYLSGAPYNGACNKYYVPATDGSAIYVGDPVKLAGSGDDNGVPDVAVCAAGNRPVGIVVGVDPVEGQSAPNLSRLYRPASTAMYLWVADDPDLVFEIQEDSVGGDLAKTSLGLNIEFIAGSGSTTTGLSGFEIDSSTAATTNTLTCQVIRLARRPDNAIGANAVYEVRINLHQYRHTTGV
jgi:hypothetical protein